MLIYGNNLHEKLQGLAISKDYLKYSTPFCDLVDDPDWELDINLALNFHSAINGNSDSATKLVQDLTLNSSVLDASTLEFYIHKITYNPAFNSAIRDMRSRWGNLDGYDDDFQKSLKDALKDCLNSPCNLFAETSDSIGRMAQSASTKSSDNTMGSLIFQTGRDAGQGDGVDNTPSTTISNMIDGLDETIRTSIPSIFMDAFTEGVSVANKAFENTQLVLAGKKNILELTSKVQEGKSFRDPAKVFRYSPDVKSYYDYSAASSNVLAKIKEDLGGCFSRFEYKYRYNPYENNMSRPIGTRVNHVNGRDYDSDSAGTADRRPNNSNRLSRQTSGGSGYRSPAGVAGQGVSKDNLKISKIYRLDQKSDRVDRHYSVFSSYIDPDNKVLWYESYAATPNDVLTLQGESNIGANYRIGISKFGPNKDFIRRALNGEGVSDLELQKYGETTQPGAYAAGYDHIISDEGMETLYKWNESQTFNDGVAISKKLFNAFINDSTVGVGSASYKKPQEANEFFVAARPAGKSNWKYYKVIDSNSQSDYNVDFTVGAWKHFLNSYGLGELTAASSGVARYKPIEGTDWRRVEKIFTERIGGPMEVRICMGNIDQIKDELGDLDDSDAFESSSSSTPIANANVSFAQAGIRNKPIQPKLLRMIEEASARSGYRIVVYSGGQMAKAEAIARGAVKRGNTWYLNGVAVRTGSTRHDDGWAADIRIFDGSTRLSAENSSHFDRLSKFVRILKSVGIDSVGAGPGYMAGNLHIDIAINNGNSGSSARTWGAGGRSKNTPSWLRNSF